MDQNFLNSGRSRTQAGMDSIQGATDPSPPVIPDHELLRCIGRGSYGAVWLARNMMGMHRAVKIVYRNSFIDHRPFERELSGIRKFEPISRSHEGFVDVLQVGINEEEGHFYYVMELGDDQNTGQKIDPESYRPKTLDKEILLRRKLSFQECLELGLALSLALSELHKHGLVHRDVKPSNIIFVHGVPKLADIGLVTEANQAQSFVGTAGFIPPEGPGTPQADVYSLGKVLYEASTGKDRQDFPELPTHLDTLSDRDGFLELNEVILQACKNDITKRYQTAWFMHADLLVLANGKSVRRLKVLERRLSNLKRVAGISALVATLIGVIGFQIYREWKIVDESHQRAVGENIAYGNRATESGDLLGALPYFADALLLDEKNPFHRLRIGSVLSQCPKLTQMYFEGGLIEAGAFSPDGRKIAIVGPIGKLKTYDLQTGESFLQPAGPTRGLKGVAYSADGKFIAIATVDDHLASVLKADTLEEVCSFHHPNWVITARFNAEGTRLVTACGDGIARVWNIQSTNLELSLPHGGRGRFANFSKDGQLIVTCGEDGTARIWNATTGQAIGTPLQHAGWVTWADFSPDGKCLATSASDHKARVWELATGRMISPELVHHDYVTDVEFSRDGRLLLTASLDGTVRLWMADTFQPFQPNPILRHGEKVTHASFDADGRRIISTCADGSIRVWDLAGSLLPSSCPKSLFSEDGERALRISNKSIEIQDTSKTNSLTITAALPMEKARFSHSGRFFLTTSSIQTNSSGTNRVLQVWNAATGQPVAPGLSFTNTVVNGFVSDDGTRLAVVSGKILQIWDVIARQPLSPQLLHPQKVKSASFSPNGNQVSAISVKAVHVWNTASGTAAFAPLQHDRPVTHVEFSPDGSHLVSGCSDDTFAKCYAQVWDFATGKPAGPRLLHGDGVLFDCFSPDGRRVATACEDFSASVWDALTGRRIATLPHDEKVESARFSPDASEVVTASVDRTARVWDAETGEPVTPPMRHIHELASAQFIAKGHRIATTDMEGLTWIWDVPLDERSPGDLRKIARLLSGDMSTSRSLAPTQSEPLEAIWKQLRIAFPSNFTVSTSEIAAWHEFQAEESEYNHQWAAAIFHLERLFSLRPNDPVLTTRVAKVKALLEKGN